jgi:hypothetical protein
MPSAKQMSIVLDGDVKEWLKIISEQEQRTLSGMIRYLLYNLMLDWKAEQEIGGE